MVKLRSFLLVHGAARLWGAAVLVWFLAVLVGLGILGKYGSTPGTAAAAPSDWPVASRIPRTANRASLVIFGHPHCPCTRATVSELARLMSGIGDKVTARVLFVKPKGAAPDWDNTDLRARTASIPGVQVATDEGGQEAKLFGATVSGQTLLYDSDGRLIFRGGITASRGHEGDNAGSDSISSFLLHGVIQHRSTNVYGCVLDDSSPSMANMK